MMRTTLVVATAATLGLISVGTANAKTCKPLVESYGSPPFLVKNQAKGAAIEYWRQDVVRKYGGFYAVWGNSSSRSISCHTAKTVQPGVSRFSCKAKAKPCVPYALDE